MSTRLTGFICLLLSVLASPSDTWAHRLDEYLQATLVAIAPAEIRLQINLLPGVAVADEVLALIDGNHDGVISKGEAAAYADSLRRDLTLRLDEQFLNLSLTASEFPDPAEMRSGAGIIQLIFTAKFEALPVGHHLTIENRHLRKLSAHLLNAAKPELARVQVTHQRRNDDQSAGEIDFTISPLPSAPAAAAKSP